MRQSTPYLALATLLLGSLLSACGGNQSTSTSTPSSTLGTDSAATKAGGTPSTMASPTDPNSTMPASGASGSSNASGTGAGTGADAPGASTTTGTGK